MSHSHSTSSGLAPLSRSPALPHPSLPLNTRDLYTGATPHLRRTSDLLARSPSLSHHSSSLRGGASLSLSPSSTSGFTSPISNMDSSLGGGPASPPLFPTEVAYNLQSADGQIIKPEIFGKIDKGFFMADGDWTCYRRNYFSLNCSYTLSPTVPTGPMYLVQHNGAGPAVQAFAMSIAAVVDGRDGKSIELVQHTPKRDKGPQEKPARMTLAPRPPASHGMYGSDSMSARAEMYVPPTFSPNPNQPAVEATFERIQFKNATANNGKRRAAQQYYHLLVELFADVGPQHPERWIKIASRMSAAMVVRGRSPGHYQGERRGSNSSAGPGGGGGGGGGTGGGSTGGGPGGPYTPSGSSGRTPGDMGMGSSTMLPGSAYSGHSSYDSRHYRSNGQQPAQHQHPQAIPPLQVPLEPTLSQDEAKGIEDSPCYLYYPGTIYENQGPGPQEGGAGGRGGGFTLPSVGEYATNRVKGDSFGGGGGGVGGGGYVLPSLQTTGAEHQAAGAGYGRGCGRWEGVESSRGFFPSGLVQQEMNLT